MKKPKVKKETLKSTKEAYLAYKESAQKFMYSLQNPVTRRILGVDATDAQGKLNGMTIVELIAITNLLSTTGEKLFLVPFKNSIIGYAVKDPQRAPTELL